MMVTLAKAGKNVVRLKGRPDDFWPRGRKIAKLKAEQIEVSVVPWITAALAMAAELGVSLTHRDCAQSVRFITGHSRQGDLPKDVDWQKVADPKTTTIFYMGGRTAGKFNRPCLKITCHLRHPLLSLNLLVERKRSAGGGTLSSLEKGIEHLGYDKPVLIGTGAAFSTVQCSEDHDNVSLERFYAH